MEETTQIRTKTLVNEEYSKCCALLGDKVKKIELLNLENTKLLARMDELIKEHADAPEVTLEEKSA